MENLSYNPEKKTLGEILHLTDEEVVGLDEEMYQMITAHKDANDNVIIPLEQVVMAFEKRINEDPLFKRTACLKLVLVLIQHLEEAGVLTTAPIETITN